MTLILPQMGGFYRPGPEWTPADITTTLWLDASGVSTITSSSGLVSQWDDKSGNALHVSSPTSDVQPGTGTNTINGKNVIYFDGSEYMNRSSTTICATVMLCFVVFRKTGANNSYEAHPFVLNSTNLGKPFDAYNDNVVINNKQKSDLHDLRTVTTASILSTLIVKDGQSSDTHSITRKLNGTQVDDASATVTWSADPQNIRLGQRTDEVTKFTGDLAEVVVFENTLSTSDTEKMEGYLAHKWGLEGNLPAAHPYKTTAP